MKYKEMFSFVTWLTNDIESIGFAEKNKLRLENLGYSLVKTEVNILTSCLTYRKEGK